MKLTLIRGCPGSGKSTFAKKNYHCLILENDQFMYRDGKYCWSRIAVDKAIDTVRDFAALALLRNADVVVCNTFTKAQFVRGYQELARKFGADFEVIRMDNDFGNIHNVPAETLKNMRDSFEPWEGERIIKFT